MASPQTVSAPDLHAAIDRLAAAILERHRDSARLILLGIANGGIELARRLATQLAASRPASHASRPHACGVLDISFHRDDFARHPIPKEFAPTHIPADVTGATVILVDDVLFSGRTVKAALDELFDHGRPAKVELAILVDRGGRRLPVAPDYCGLTLSVAESEKVVVRLDPEFPKRDLLRVDPAASAARSTPA